MKGLARLVTAMGVLTLLVATLHFVMMPKLTGMIARAVGPRGEEFVVPIFYINHIGSGIYFQLALGGLALVGLVVAVPVLSRWRSFR